MGRRARVEHSLRRHIGHALGGRVGGAADLVQPARQPQPLDGMPDRVEPHRALRVRPRRRGKVHLAEQPPRPRGRGDQQFEHDRAELGGQRERVERGGQRHGRVQQRAQQQPPLPHLVREQAGVHPRPPPRGPEHPPADPVTAGAGQQQVGDGAVLLLPAERDAEDVGQRRGHPDGAGQAGDPTQLHRLVEERSPPRARGAVQPHMRVQHEPGRVQRPSVPQARRRAEGGGQRRPRKGCARLPHRPAPHRR